MGQYSKNRFMAQGEKISLSAVGIRVSYKGLKTRGRWLEDVKRGQIKGFSKASARRLRELLESKYLGEDETVVGFTFTLPGKVASDDFWKGYENEFLRIIKRFRDRIYRLIPSSVLIYRIELQQRGAPHIHAILRLSKADYEAFDWMEIPSSWRACVRWESFPKMTEKEFLRRSGQFIEHGVDMQINLNNASPKSIMRYLCDHASKHKQAQLGWKGRQWGIIGKRRLLVSRPRVELTGLDERATAALWRDLRKVQRYRKPAACVFGSKLVGGHRITGTIFLNPAMIEGVARHYPPQISAKIKTLLSGAHRMTPGQNARQ